MSDKWGAGDRAKWSDHGEVIVGKKAYQLIYGEHPHSRQDNKHYVDFGRDEPTGFDGHRVLIGVTIESSNYLKSSGLSGDEVRKGGSAKIFADGEQVFEFFFRDPQWALRRADHLISELGEHSSNWLSRRERERLEGRKVFYGITPAIIKCLITEQGCVILVPDGVPAFPRPVWASDDFYDDDRDAVKVEVTDPHIWWFRK